MKRSLVVVLGLSMVCACVGTATAYEDGDWQVWNNNSIETKIADGWKARIAGEFRMGDNAREICEQFTEIGVSHDLTKWLNLGVDYRHDYKLSGSAWAMEKRPQFNATLAFKSVGFGFKDRSRLERRMPAVGDNAWRYRNKLTVILPKTLTGSRVQLYAAGEAFVDLAPNNFSRYRLYAGAKGKIAGPLGLDLSYFCQSTEKGDDRSSINVISVALKGQF